LDGLRYEWSRNQAEDGCVQGGAEGDGLHPKMRVIAIEFVTMGDGQMKGSRFSGEQTIWPDERGWPSPAWSMEGCASDGART
jgi:hypothetical protein